MNKKISKALSLAFTSFLVVAFATIGVRAQESGGAITGAAGSENLTGEIRWKKVVGLPPADASGSVPLQNICQPFSVVILEGGSVISSDTQLKPGRYDGEYYRCKYKLFAPRNKQIAVRAAMSDEYYRNAWFGGQALLPAHPGGIQELPGVGGKSRIYVPPFDGESRVFDKREKFVTLGPNKGIWLPFELATGIELSSRTQTYTASQIEMSIGWSRRAPMDWCREWQVNCGKPAADAFCQWQGFEAAKSFEKAANLPETVTITEKTICNKSNSPVCDGFQQIVCMRK